MTSSFGVTTGFIRSPHQSTRRQKLTPPMDRQTVEAIAHPPGGPSVALRWLCGAARTLPHHPSSGFSLRRPASMSSGWTSLMKYSTASGYS
jgi:hypothetical protein